MKTLTGLSLVLGICLASQTWAAVNCSYNVSGVRFSLSGVSSTGVLDATLGQPGFSLASKFSIKPSDISVFSVVGNDLRFLVMASKAQPKSTVRIEGHASRTGGSIFAGHFSIYYQGVDGTWSVEDAPIQCQ